LADALIAATAEANGLGVLTGNGKHYAIFKDVQIIRFHPE
jgi:predicted nucleic acid-binding protein